MVQSAFDPGTARVDAASLASAPGASRKADDQALFSQVISKAKIQGTPEQKARGAAEQLVATALIQPVLKGLRESNNAAPPFGPNEAERSFRSLMDAGLAQRMVHAQHWALIDSVAQKLLKKSGQVALKATAPAPAELHQ